VYLGCPKIFGWAALWNKGRQCSKLTVASPFANITYLRSLVSSVALRYSQLSSQIRLCDTAARVSIAGMYFQVEEMEDKDSCTTEVFLNSNNTVTLLETNGPVFVSATGSWNLEGDGSFEMTLSRTYEGGRSTKSLTGIGVFPYVTNRSFLGQLSKIGVKQGIEGSVYDIDSGSTERKVGFFEMIDTTVGADGEEGLRGGILSTS
jgi:hypothetical protein